MSISGKFRKNGDYLEYLEKDEVLLRWSLTQPTIICFSLINKEEKISAILKAISSLNEDCSD